MLAFVTFLPLTGGLLLLSSHHTFPTAVGDIGHGIPFTWARKDRPSWTWGLGSRNREFGMGESIGNGFWLLPKLQIFPGHRIC